MLMEQLIKCFTAKHPFGALVKSWRLLLLVVKLLNIQHIWAGTVKFLLMCLKLAILYIHSVPQRVTYTSCFLKDKIPLAILVLGSKSAVVLAESHLLMLASGLFCCCVGSCSLTDCCQNTCCLSANLWPHKYSLALFLICCEAHNILVHSLLIYHTWSKY